MKKSIIGVTSLWNEEKNSSAVVARSLLLNGQIADRVAAAAAGADKEVPLAGTPFTLEKRRETVEIPAESNFSDGGYNG